ncbi:MAG: epimerase [Pseudomonadota bacterium]|jgi:NAD(P)-dependent dehydrogenase (short-subunit alcohol dehydrogenase family)|nr:MAG: epimerase [Pseudomonadota bacterium]|tara:strand:+ start:989 stop:1747 length:759 start_codon:yes stop_codon:yes gene_type:complete
MIDFTGKTILITGGSRGIGAATVRQVVAHGGKVLIHFGSNRTAAEALAREVGETSVVLCQADLTSESETERLWDEAVSWQGRIDVLVNNAGIYEKSPLDLDLETWLSDWQRTLRINLLAAAQLCRRAVEHFRACGGGILINVSSRSGKRGDNIDHLHYGASKAGMLALNRTIARDCAGENILAYGIAPGFVLTDMVERVVTEKGLDAMAALYPTGKVATPEEVANVITFLASGAAPQATGNTIDLSGAAEVS